MDYVTILLTHFIPYIVNIVGDNKLPCLVEYVIWKGSELDWIGFKAIQVYPLRAESLKDSKQ